MAKNNLPSLISEIAGGRVTWERLEHIEFETLGFFLSCHLIIEHYIDELLGVSNSKLNWELARLTFSEKISLLSDFEENFRIPSAYNFVASVKHLNSLRNKISHNVDFKISERDLEHYPRAIHFFPMYFSRWFH